MPRIPEAALVMLSRVWWRKGSARSALPKWDTWFGITCTLKQTEPVNAHLALPFQRGWEFSLGLFVKPYSQLEV